MDNQQIIDIAQHSIKQKVLSNIDWEPDLVDPWMQTHAGVFTTLYTDTGDLRGCVGVPYPDHPIGKAIAISARRSATDDYRFSPVTPEELDSITISVEVLSEFTPIMYDDLDDLLHQIEIGTMGLTVKYKDYAALFLPRVAKEQGWDPHDYVVNLCRKGYIPPSFIGVKPVEFASFTTQFFSQ